MRVDIPIHMSRAVEGDAFVHAPLCINDSVINAADFVEIILPTLGEMSAYNVQLQQLNSATFPRVFAPR